jgi:hypothetical protein
METNKETNKITKSKRRSPSSEPNIFSAVMKDFLLLYHAFLITFKFLSPTNALFIKI